jgi:colicin import membrane protein
MRNTSSRLSALGVLVAAFVAIPAAADPPGSPGKSDKAEKAAAKAEMKAAKADEKADKKAAKADEKAAKADEKADKKAAKDEEKSDERAENKDEKEHEHGMGPDGARGHGHGGFRALSHEFAKGSITKAELKDRVATMRKDRNERRHEHRVDLKSRWGATLANPACREELRHHARREAFLDRALFVAQTEVTTKDKDKLVERIQKLIDKEEERHTKAMERLKSMPAPAPTAATPAAPAAPAAPAKEGAQ